MSRDLAYDNNVLKIRPSIARQMYNIIEVSSMSNMRRDVLKRHNTHERQSYTKSVLYII